MEKKIYEFIKKGESCRDRSQFIEALKFFKKAFFMSKRHNIVDGILDSTIAMADIYRMIGDFDSAIKNYEEAVESAEALGNELTAADCLAGMGLSLRAMGMWKEAIHFISTAKKIYKRNKDDKGFAFALWAEGGALRVAGDIKKAISKFQESKKIFERLGDKSGIAYSLCGLGGIYRISGRFEESKEYYIQANDIFKRLRDKFGIAYSHCGIGNAFRMFKNYNEALRHFKKAMRVYEEIGDIVSYSYTLWSLANLYKMEGDLEIAVDYLQRALKNFRKTKDPRGIIYCDLTFGEIDFINNQKASAERKLMNALKNSESHGFKLETCHCLMFLNYLKNPDISKLTSCYKKIGVNLNFDGIPFNIP